MVSSSVAPNRGTEQVERLLAGPEIAGLIADLEATRWTGRPGYPVRMMVGMALVKALYALPTWTRTVALVTEHPSLRAVIGCRSAHDVPSVHACYRLTAKLRAHGEVLNACIGRIQLFLGEGGPPGRPERLVLVGNSRSAIRVSASPRGPQRSGWPPRAKSPPRRSRKRLPMVRDGSKGG